MKRCRAAKLSALIAAMALLCAPLPSCKENPEPKNRTFYGYFDTVSVFYDYSGMSDAEFAQLSAEVEDMLAEYHRLYDIYNEYDGINNLATVNRLAGGGAVEVDEEIIELMEFAQQMYQLTDGAVNAAMGSVLSIWHEYRGEGVAIPTEEELSAAGEHISMSSVEIDREGTALRISDPLASIDVGALAKGFAAEKIAQELSSRGLCGLVIDLGGNLRAVGEKPDGSGWVSGIRNAAGDGYYRTLTVSDSALVTSGNYERFYTVAGKHYHHIINPDTLMPGELYISVSVHAPSSAVADALSTAFFNMTEQEIIAVLDKFPDVSATLVDMNENIHILEKS